MMRRRGSAVVVAASCLAALAVTGCGENKREGYCAQVAEQSTGLMKTVDEGGPVSGLLNALPTLEEISEHAPRDIRDEYDVFLDALRGLDTALDDAGLEPSDVPDGKLPTDVSETDRKALLDATVHLASAEVQAAATSVEQHALDVCHTRLL